MKDTIIFKGKIRPSTQWVGVNAAPLIRKDQFGRLHPGNIRAALINTRYGQLHSPLKYMNKDIEIIVRLRPTVNENDRKRMKVK